MARPIDAASDGYVDFSTNEKYVWDPEYSGAFRKIAGNTNVFKKRQEIERETLAIQTSLQALHPTSEQSATHQKLIQLYAFFVEYTSLASPEGSYTSYTQQEATSKASFLRKYSELKIELPAPATAE